MRVRRFDNFSEIRTEWEGLVRGSKRRPVIYPFNNSNYWQLFSESFCKTQDVFVLGVYDNDELVCLGAFEKIEKEVVFLGMKSVANGQEVTDYGDVIYRKNIENGQVSVIWRALLGELRAIGAERVRLDFVRSDSLTLDVVKGNGKVSLQEVSPGLDLKEIKSWEDYLAALPRVKRKELRRKIRRLEEEKAFTFCEEGSFERDFGDFIKLNRLSSKEKNKFMSEEMEKFFWRLVNLDLAPWKHRFCFLSLEGKRVAATLSFYDTYDSQKVLLYNSGFDPEYAYYSVGLILKAFGIKKAIEEGMQFYDFLRGDERYKYDLGAMDSMLNKIEITLEG
jgi:hypothetical protein